MTLSPVSFKLPAVLLKMSLVSIKLLFLVGEGLKSIGLSTLGESVVVSLAFAFNIVLKSRGYYYEFTRL